ncbi:MAG: repressor LexA [Planctomycetes bacterium]|nr:repressor LexA [Planctomycetota bacterium]
MSTQLPPGQTKILTYFADAEDAGRQPSRAEVAEAMGYAFPSAVSKHVDALVRKGLLEADREKKRNVRLTESGWDSIGRTPAKKGVPVIGAIAAGTPILATESHAGYLRDIQPAPGRFALKVRGDSMIDAGINDGDYAVIQSEATVGNNKIGAVIVDGEATLKRVRYHNDRIELIPQNPRYQALVIPKSKAATVQIVGPLCFIYRAVD